MQTYAGPLGARSAALVAFLQAIPGVQPLPEGVNPASWMLEEMGRGGSDERGRARNAPDDVEEGGLDRQAGPDISALLGLVLVPLRLVLVPLRLVLGLLCLHVVRPDRL